MPVTQAQKAQILLELVSPFLVAVPFTRGTELTFVDNGLALLGVCHWSTAERRRLLRNTSHRVSCDFLQRSVVRCHPAQLLCYDVLVFRIGDAHRFSIHLPPRWYDEHDEYVHPVHRTDGTIEFDRTTKRFFLNRRWQGQAIQGIYHTFRPGPVLRRDYHRQSAEYVVNEHIH